MTAAFMADVDAVMAEDVDTVMAELADALQHRVIIVRSLFSKNTLSSQCGDWV